MNPEQVRAWSQARENLLWRLEDDEDAQNLALDKRNLSVFDSQWVRVEQIIRLQENGAPLDQNEKNALEQLRELAYRKACLHGGLTEIPAYVADDFELFWRAARVGLKDFWLTRLWNCHENGDFPCGNLTG